MNRRNNTLTHQEFIKRQKKRKQNIKLIQIAILVLFIAIWELAAQTGMINAFIFSSPSRIVRTIFDMSADGSLWLHIGTTLYETLLSFALVMGIGILAAILLWCVPVVSEILDPYLVMLNSLPKSALAPVLIVWLGNQTKTIIIAAISVAIFGTILTLYTNFQTTDPGQIKLIYTLGGKRRDVMTKVLLPGSIPNLISNMKVNIGLCLVGVIIGEFLAAKQGLGFLIIYGSQVFKLDYVMMSIIILCIIAMGLYVLLTTIEKKYNRQS